MNERNVKAVSMYLYKKACNEFMPLQSLSMPEMSEYIDSKYGVEVISVYKQMKGYPYPFWSLLFKYEIGAVNLCYYYSEPFDRYGMCTVSFSFYPYQLKDVDEYILNNHLDVDAILSDTNIG